MTDAQIAGNKTISNFIGGTPQYKKAEKYYRDEIEDQRSPDLTGLKYHSSYDWLMPVAKMLVNDYYESHDLDDLMNAGGRFDLDEIFEQVVATIIEIEKSV
jgi:hypothetical protein